MLDPFFEYPQGHPGHLDDGLRIDHGRRSLRGLSAPRNERAVDVFLQLLDEAVDLVRRERRNVGNGFTSPACVGEGAREGSRGATHLLSGGRRRERSC
jgi:hypothetical protein